jgi:hypothetical protein
MSFIDSIIAAGIVGGCVALLIGVLMIATSFSSYEGRSRGVGILYADNALVGLSLGLGLLSRLGTTVPLLALPPIIFLCLFLGSASRYWRIDALPQANRSKRP